MVAIIENDPEVPPGTYGDYLHEFCVPFRVFRPYAGEELPLPDEMRALIVLGGSMGVHEAERHPFLHDVRKLMAAALEGEVPLLGICLGGQLLAAILGANVTPRSPYGERGSRAVSLTDEGAADPLFAGMPRQFVSFQWHDDSFAVPAGAATLASSERCPNQAFRWGSVAYGVQFHPEVNRRIIETWACWSEETAADADRFVADFDWFNDDYSAASRLLLHNFLSLSHIL